MSRILADTGPLVAIISSEDEYHEACVEALRTMASPLLTCWPVITEAAWLLRKSPKAVQRLLRSLDDGFLELLPLTGPDANSILAIMEKFEGIHPQLADAALVYLGRREQIDTIFTLDRRDFSIYTYGRNRKFRILPDTT